MGILQELIECERGCAEARETSLCDECESDYRAEQSLCLDMRDAQINECDAEAEARYAACRH
jgi:hypothetical protein